MSNIVTTEGVDDSVSIIFPELDKIKKQEKRIINVLLMYISLKINENGYDLPVALGWNKQEIKTIKYMRVENCNTDSIKSKVYSLAKDINRYEMMKVNN